jgi:hypothetical protein
MIIPAVKLFRVGEICAVTFFSSLSGSSGGVMTRDAYKIFRCMKSNTVNQKTSNKKKVKNNETGFAYDYYSGKTATADQPSRCLGITPEAWALGGPVSHFGNIKQPHQQELLYTPAAPCLSYRRYSENFGRYDRSIDRERFSCIWRW